MEIAAAATRPRFKASVEPVIDPDDGLFLLMDGTSAWLADPIFAAIAEYLTGDHEIEDLFDGLVDRYPAERILAALDRLEASGYLAGNASDDLRSVRAFWEHAGVSSVDARTRIDAARVSVITYGEVQTEALSALLTAQGVRVDAHGDVTIIVCDDYLDPRLAVWNSAAIAASSPWLLVKPVGAETLVGPLFVPGQTACWECLAHRLRGHRRVEEYIARRRGDRIRVTAPLGAIASTQHSALADAATEITRWIATSGRSSVLNRVVSTRSLTMKREHHTLIRRPQCPSCGNSEMRTESRPIVLRFTPKLHTLGGGHRATEPARVLEQLTKHVSHLTGIVGSLQRGSRSGPEAATFIADHNFSDMHDDRFFLREGLRRRSGGKGKTDEQARISALAESLERYCGVFDGTEARVRSTYDALASSAIRPNIVLGYSDGQYASREAHNLKEHKAHWVPERFRDDVQIEWSPLWSLTSETTRYLPTSQCYYGYRSADPVFARADSNGCASGSVVEEAILQGLLELIERDAVAIWWYNRVSRAGVDLESTGDDYIGKLVSHYRQLRRDIWALDVTSDLGVPTFAAISRRTDKPEEDIIYGFGAHLDPAVALTRALTEVNQSLEAVPAADGPESSRTYRGGRDSLTWWRSVRTADAEYLCANPDVPARRLEDFVNTSSDDLREDVRACVERLASRGIETLALDQTRPDVEFPVVRVVAPGLRHFWARFGPGRLYDVPVRQGWLQRPLAEADLNPFVIQF